MPSFDHEGLVLLFRNEPSLALRLLKQGWDLSLPEEEARIAEANLSDLDPAEYRADLVVAVGRKLRVVVEIQLGRDPRKHYAWPAYVANLRAREKCPVVLLVIAPNGPVAEWARTPIELGPPGFCLTPYVIGPGSIPLIADPDQARREPELAVLSAIWHGKAGRADAALAALLALWHLDLDRSTIYADLVLRALSGAARRELEEMMASGTYEYQSDFARKYFKAGQAEGEARGEARGRAEGVLAVLGVRGLSVSAEQRARILESNDPESLERWLRRAATVETVDDLFM